MLSLVIFTATSIWIISFCMISANKKSTTLSFNFPLWKIQFTQDHDEVSIQRNVRGYVDWLKGMHDEIDEFESKHPERHDLFNQKPMQNLKNSAPSVFPVYMPSVRIYRYEYRDSPEQGATHKYGTLLGYSQFVANISRYNEEDGHKDPKPPLDFDLEYDTKTLYGLSDLSVDAYIEFADALTQNDSESKQLWNTYCKNMFLQTLNSTFDD